jgi:hypothetical protein
MFMDAATQAVVLRDHVLPAFQARGIATKLLVWDHNWDRPDYPEAVLADPALLASEQVAGVAWHGYGGAPEAMATLRDKYPTKGQYQTELSGGTWVAHQVQADFVTIIRSMRSWARAFVKWSLALDENRGPHTGGCGTCSPLVTVNTGNGSVTPTTDFYTLGHFSKFVRSGAVRIHSTEVGSLVSAANPSVGRVYVFFGPFDGRDLQAADADVTITGLEFADLVGTPRGGDLDDDGVNDLVIGARGPDVGGTLNGQVWVFKGPLAAGDLLVSDADATITGTSFSELGRSLAIGDFDDDGMDDILAGASESAGGKAHLFYGPVSGELTSADADATVSATQGAEGLGRAVAAVDLNDDGVDDLAIGAPDFVVDGASRGAVFVFFGPLVGDHTLTAADVTLTGEGLRDEFGSFLANGGDVDDDGSEDLLVGAWQLFADVSAGKAYVFYGPLAPGTVPASDAGAILNAEPVGVLGDLFGILDTAGDVDGDGFDDVVVGAQFAGAEDHGRAYVFRGPLAGEIGAGDADWIFDAPGFDADGGFDILGRGVGAAGDLDGDGRAEVLLGAPGSDGPGFARVVFFDGPIFADGFESGDTSAWSSSVP